MKKFKKLIIACDGESASGKSTAAKLVSKKYKLYLINSGLLYRYASKEIINGLNHSDQNFSLEVSSAGIGSPIVNKRQYKKNIGRFLEVKINSGEFYKGQLKSFNNDFIEINSKVKEPKKKGKGSFTVDKLKLIKLDEISNAKVVI